MTPPLNPDGPSILYRPKDPRVEDRASTGPPLNELNSADPDVSHGHRTWHERGPLWDHHSVLGRLHHIIFDCPDPQALALFYSALLGHPITYDSEEFVVVANDDTSSGLAFQLAPHYRRPTWPSTDVPHQMHLDVMVEDVADATPQVLALGATKLDGEGVFADPAGHPFCLVKRPKWAESIDG
jgi:catechol 2,3-dioxygenase-like lactoylglutathione lyase family enzyme